MLYAITPNALATFNLFVYRYMISCNMIYYIILYIYHIIYDITKYDFVTSGATLSMTTSILVLCSSTIPETADPSGLITGSTDLIMDAKTLILVWRNMRGLCEAHNPRIARLCISCGRVISTVVRQMKPIVIYASHTCILCFCND